MSLGPYVRQEMHAAIIAEAAENPRLSHAAIAQRHGLDRTTVTKLLARHRLGLAEHDDDMPVLSPEQEASIRLMISRGRGDAYIASYHRVPVSCVRWQREMHKRDKADERNAKRRVDEGPLGKCRDSEEMLRDPGKLLEALEAWGRRPEPATAEELRAEHIADLLALAAAREARA